MNRTDTVVNSATFLVRVCIANFSEKTDTVRVFVNKQEVAKERTLRIGKEGNPCPGTYYFTRTVNLGEGENVIRVVATNATGVSESRRTVKNFKPETRLALVIGNAAYPGEDALKNPVNDATDMAKALEKLG
ncbi:MAG: caspase family protein, partial [Pedobacter sp.]